MGCLLTITSRMGLCLSCPQPPLALPPLRELWQGGNRGQTAGCCRGQEMQRVWPGDGVLWLYWGVSVGPGLNPRPLCDLRSLTQGPCVLASVTEQEFCLPSRFLQTGPRLGGERESWTQNIRRHVLSPGAEWALLRSGPLTGLPSDLGHVYKGWLKKSFAPCLQTVKTGSHSHCHERTRKILRYGLSFHCVFF